MREKKNINVEIGKRIKIARESAGLTQERFAELVQLGPKNVSAIECGAAGISVSTLKHICEVLSVSADVILFGEIKNSDEVSVLTDRLNRLAPEQLEISCRMLNTLFEAFSIENK